MNNKFNKLKLISNAAIALVFVLFVAMLADMAMVYITWPSYLALGSPDSKAILHAVFYIPCIIAALIVHLVIYKKVRRDFPEKFPKKGKLGKKQILQRMVMTLTITLASLFVFLLLAPYVVMPVMLTRHVSYLGHVTKNNPLQDIYVASDYGLDETQRFLTTEDGLKIWTSEIYTEKPKGVIIYLSGIFQPSVTYFYGHAKFMKENGFASILLEVRGHGKSEGNRVSLGYEEEKDVRAVVDYIKGQDKYKDVPIVIQGVSMGGAVSVNAFGQIKEIDALIALSAYSSFEDVAMDQMGKYGIPKFILRIEKPIVRSALGLIYGKDKVASIKPIEQIKNTYGRPVLLMACSGDTEVPPANMRRLKSSNPEVQTWLRDSWEHFIVKDCNLKEMYLDKEYCDKIINFLNSEVVRNRQD